MDSYADLTYLNDFMSKRAITDNWTDDEKNAALYIGANDYIDVKYKFAGTAEGETQTLALPTDEVEVTDKVKRANCEAALLYLNGKLFNTELDVNGAIKVKMSREKLDVLEEESEIEYFNSSGQTYLIDHPQIDALLRDYLSSASVGSPSLGYVL